MNPATRAFTISDDVGISHMYTLYTIRVIAAVKTPMKMPMYCDGIGNSYSKRPSITNNEAMNVKVYNFRFLPMSNPPHIVIACVTLQVANKSRFYKLFLKKLKWLKVK